MQVQSNFPGRFSIVTHTMFYILQFLSKVCMQYRHRFPLTISLAQRSILSFRPFISRNLNLSLSTLFGFVQIAAQNYIAARFRRIVSISVYLCILYKQLQLVLIQQIAAQLHSSQVQKDSQYLVVCIHVYCMYRH